MEQTYTLKEVAAILSPSGEREDFERAARQVRHWTVNGLLEPAGEKFVGTGRSRRYGADEIRFAAWLMELAKYGINISVMEAVRHTFDEESYADLWDTIADADPPVFYELVWDEDAIIGKFSYGAPELVTGARLDEKRRRRIANPKDGLIDPANITSAVVINLTKVFARLKF
jgi:DNA-binding transcriptional MerR regulator